MEPFLENMMNNKKIPRIIKFIAVTILYGILETVFILVLVNAKELWSQLLCLLFALILIGSYLLSVFRIIRYNRVGEDKKEE